MTSMNSSIAEKTQCSTSERLQKKFLIICVFIYAYFLTARYQAALHDDMFVCAVVQLMIQQDVTCRGTADTDVQTDVVSA